MRGRRTINRLYQPIFSFLKPYIENQYHENLLITAEVCKETGYEGIYKQQMGSQSTVKLKRFQYNKKYNKIHKPVSSRPYNWKLHRLSPDRN